MISMDSTAGVCGTEDSLVPISSNTSSGCRSPSIAARTRGKLRRIAEAPTGGFETRIVVPGEPRFVRVQPLARNGHALSGSRTTRTKRL